MGIIAWIILGLLAGVIAKALLPGDDPGVYRALVGRGTRGRTAY